MLVNQKLDCDASSIIELNYSLMLHFLILMYECLFLGLKYQSPSFDLYIVWISELISSLCHVIICDMEQISLAIQTYPHRLKKKKESDIFLSVTVKVN